MVRGLLILLVFCLSITVTVNTYANELKMDINTATVEDLIRVKGIGKKRAQAIIDYIRKSNGIRDMDELLNVRGIGEKVLERLKIEFGVKKEDG